MPSGCYNFKMSCENKSVCSQNRTSARPIINANRNGQVSNDKFVLRKAMGFTYLSCSGSSVDSEVLLKYNTTTPFRAKEGLVPICGTGPNPHNCENEPSKKRYSVGNTKYVYDSSDYIKFKRLSAKNKNYGDCSFGGDDHNANQSTQRRK